MRTFMAMHRGAPTHSLWSGLRHFLSHGVITLLAVAIAFSLPGMANYILNEWWPHVERNPNLLLATEIALASVLALLFNLAKIAWDHRQGVRIARLASLMYARNAGAGWWSRRRERALVRQLPAARDAFVLTLTGYDTFVADDSLLRGVIEKAYEIRVMLVNPVGKALFFFSSRRRHTIFDCDWSSDVCSSDLGNGRGPDAAPGGAGGPPVRERRRGRATGDARLRRAEGRAGARRRHAGAAGAGGRPDCLCRREPRPPWPRGQRGDRRPRRGPGRAAPGPRGWG